MGDYPDADEEFELMYGDELELLREQEGSEIPHSPKKSRRSLDFNTPSTSGATLSQNKNLNDSISVLNHSFDAGSPEIEVVSTANEIITVSQVEESNSRKRSIQDLFGDIDDILYDDQSTLKKHKGNKHEEDLALIEHIVNLRQLAKEKHNLTTVMQKDTSKDHKERDKYNLSYRVPKYSFFAVTREDKVRIYIRFHSELYEKEEMEKIMKESSFRGVMGDYFKEVWKDAQILVDKSISSQTEELGTNSEEITILEPSLDQSKQLWVDMYKPRKYLELLSDESTNRIMLRWMKLWDKVVFNRRPKIKPVQKEDTSKKKYFELNTKLDEHGRPEHKVALLCGPPGLGKTTLAHMVARHAGYNVVEVNASDDRSTESFKTLLENATQMRSVVDQERRPNCLVFDEIDGAPSPSIDYLVKFVSGTNISKAKKGGKAKKQNILKRPIICICNDVYVPALKPLRQIAFVVNFPQISSARLAERLMEIARRQQVKTNLSAMIALAEKSNNDIRSCLSVLHFFKAQNKPVTMSDIYRTSLGQKDMQKGLFSVWSEIFHIARPNYKLTANDTESNKFLSLKNRMQRILNTVASFGDYERLAQGVFENCPHLKVKDSTMAALDKALDWFCFNDLLTKQIYSLQNYSLSSYLQYAFVVWHFIFGTMTWQKVQYPNVAYEVKTKQARRKAVISEILRGMLPSIRAFCQPISIILDILPLLATIIVPNFRPVNLHLFTKEEKDNLLRVVKIMIDYNLNYVQERTADGTYVYNMDPSIEEIITFSNCSAPKRKILSYFNKQLIAREIELEKMRMTDCHKALGPLQKQTDKKKEDVPKEKKSSPTNLPNHLQTLTAKAKAVKAKPVATETKDFFGRTVTKSLSTGKSGPEIHNDIWFQYKEGYNNAVRRKIKIADLL